MARNTLLFTLFVSELNSITKRRLSIIGKRQVDENGISLFKDVTLSSAEEQILADFYHDAFIELRSVAKYFTVSATDEAFMLSFPDNHNSQLDGTLIMALKSFCVAYALHAWLDIVAPRMAERYKEEYQQKMNVIVELLYWKAPPSTSYNVTTESRLLWPENDTMNVGDDLLAYYSLGTDCIDDITITSSDNSVIIVTKDALHHTFKIFASAAGTATLTVSSALYPSINSQRTFVCIQREVSETVQYPYIKTSQRTFFLNDEDYGYIDIDLGSFSASDITANVTDNLITLDPVADMNDGTARIRFYCHTAETTQSSFSITFAPQDGQGGWMERIYVACNENTGQQAVVNPLFYCQVGNINDPLNRPSSFEGQIRLETNDVVTIYANGGSGGTLTYQTSGSGSVNISRTDDDGFTRFTIQPVSGSKTVTFFYGTTAWTVIVTAEQQQQQPTYVSLSIVEGQTRTIPYPTGASTVRLTTTNGNVATAAKDDANGQLVISAVAAGNADIVVTNTETGARTVYQVTVTAAQQTILPFLYGLSNGDTINMVEGNETWINFFSGSEGTITFSNSNSSVATVTKSDNRLVIQALTEGSTIITLTNSTMGWSASITIAIEALPENPTFYMIVGEIDALHTPRVFEGQVSVTTDDTVTVFATGGHGGTLTYQTSGSGSVNISRTDDNGYTRFTIQPVSGTKTIVFAYNGTTWTLVVTKQTQQQQGGGEEPGGGGSEEPAEITNPSFYYVVGAISAINTPRSFEGQASVTTDDTITVYANEGSGGTLTYQTSGSGSVNISRTDDNDSSVFTIQPVSGTKTIVFYYGNTAWTLVVTKQSQGGSGQQQSSIAEYYGQIPSSGNYIYGYIRGEVEVDSGTTAPNPIIRIASDGTVNAIGNDDGYSLSYDESTQQVVQGRFIGTGIRALRIAEEAVSIASGSATLIEGSSLITETAASMLSQLSFVMTQSS